MKDTVVLYHKQCSDGFSAAWAAWKKLGSKADYIPVAHGEPPPEGLRNKTVYLVDFCYDEVIMKTMIANNKQVTALDHHKGRAPIVALTHDYRFDNDHSGAVLAWEHFHQKQKTPRLLNHIEDCDLWRFKVPHTKEIAAFLEPIPFDFKTWNILARGMENAAMRKKYIAEGKTILRYEDAKIQEIIETHTEPVLFEGYKTLAVNSKFSHSALGHAMAKKMPPISITWTQKGPTRSFSLRSANPKVNVAHIAEKFGGGGHAAAAGFSLPSNDPLPWQSIPNL